jgi:protein TonB
MASRWAVIGGSLAAHVALLFALGEIRPPELFAATSIEVLEAKQPDEPPPPPPPAKVETPSPVVNEMPKARAPKPLAAPEPEAATPAKASSLGDLPDLGLELSGGTGGGGGGFALPPPSPRAAAPAPVERTLARPKPPVVQADACDEPPAKPKLVNLPQPVYTEAARAAGIEGKVRVQITVDESGAVVDVKALTSLGHGLDEAALAAAKAASFEAALRCGRPSRSTFTVAIRFSAS